MRATLAVIFLATGCATPYQPKGFSGGYSDFLVRPRVHSISVTGNGATGQATLREYWHRRARELCGGDYEFDESASTEQQVARKRDGSPLIVSKHEVSGYATCTE